MWSILLLAAIGAELPDYEILPVPNDAVVHAMADLTQLREDGEPEIPPHRRPFIRYVWVPGAAKIDGQAVSFTVNTAISKAAVAISLPSAAGGQLIRIDLLLLLPLDDDLKTGIELWERQAAGDPYFYVSSQQFVDGPVFEKDGKKYFGKWEKATSFGGHVHLPTAVLLQGATKSTAPVQRFDRFIVKTLSQVGGGQYYLWAGIKKSPNKDMTDLEFFAFQHGVDLKRAVELRGKRRAALKKSGVTGKPRAVDEIVGLTGVVTITDDIADDNVDPKADPFKSLLDQKPDAHEAIAAKSNGMCDFALFNGKQELQDLVPDNIAKDHTIPEPYTARLQPSVSCIRCHKRENGRGFRTLRNDVGRIALSANENGKRFNILSDDGFKNPREFLDRAASEFRGNLSRLVLARDAYSEAVFLATGKGLTVEEASSAVERIQNNLQFEDVTPAVACAELGVKVSEDDGVAMLRILLPPETLPANLRESDNIGLLKQGVAITRQDWEKDYPDAALRSRPAYEALARKKAAK